MLTDSSSRYLKLPGSLAVWSNSEIFESWCETEGSVKCISNIVEIHTIADFGMGEEV